MKYIPDNLIKQLFEGLQSECVSGVGCEGWKVRGRASGGGVLVGCLLLTSL